MYWLEDIAPVLIIGLFIGFSVVLIHVAIKANAEEQAQKAHFMQDCMKDKKEYECKALLGQAFKEPDVVPVFIPIR